MTAGVLAAEVPPLPTGHDLFTLPVVVFRALVENTPCPGFTWGAEGNGE